MTAATDAAAIGDDVARHFVSPRRTAACRRRQMTLAAALALATGTTRSPPSLVDPHQDGFATLVAAMHTPVQSASLFGERCAGAARGPLRGCGQRAPHEAGGQRTRRSLRQQATLELSSPLAATGSTSCDSRGCATKEQGAGMVADRTGRRQG